MKMTKVTTAVITKRDQKIKIISHEKESEGFFLNKFTNLQINYTVVAHPVMEESWEPNSYEKWIILQTAQSITNSTGNRTRVNIMIDIVNTE
jgi:hypothetical protein